MGDQIRNTLKDSSLKMVF